MRRRSEVQGSIDERSNLEREQAQTHAPNDEGKLGAIGFYEGATLTITAGREGYSPIAYHSFEVGPLTLAVTVRHGETIAEAHARGVAVLDELMALHFDKGLARHLDRIGKTRDAAKARGYDTSRK